LPEPPTSILANIEERFRHLLLKRLYRAQRLSPRPSATGSSDGVPQAFPLMPTSSSSTMGTMNPTDSKGSPVT
jgi:hypothetical protein